MPDQTQASTATYHRELPSGSIDPNRFKRFQQMALFLLVAAVFAIAFYTILGLATGVWQIAAEAGLIIVGLICLTIGYRATRRGQFDLAGYLVLFGLALVYGGPELLWSGATIYLAVGGLMLIFLVGDLLLPRRPRSWFIAAALFSVFLWLANRVSLWPRFDYSQSPFLNLFVPFITVALAAASLWQIARAYLNYSLRTKLIIAFLAVSLISVGAIALYADRTIRLALQDQSSSALTDAAQLQGTTIGDLLVKEVQLLRTASLNEITRDRATASNAGYQGSPADIQAAILVLDREWIAAAEANDDTNPLIRSRLDNSIAEHLREYRALHPENVEVFVTDRYGALLGATNRTSDYYQADEAWWQAAFNDGNGAIYYAQPDYDPSSSTYSIDIAFPLYDRDGKTIIGVMRTTVDLAAIVTLLTNAHVGQTGRVDMLLPNKTYLQSQGVITASAHLLAKLPAPLAGTSEVDWEDGVSSFAAVAPVYSADPELGSTIGQLNWQIIAHQSRAEVLAPVDAQTGTVLLVIALVAVMVVGASVGLSQILVRPITRLTTVAKKVSEGDLTAQAAVETGDEVGTLAVTFNNMTTQLRGLVGSLETQVQARTAQLQASADVGRAASSILNTEQLLREAVKLISERFDFYYVAVFTVDESGRWAILREATGEAGQQLKDQGHALPIGGKSMVGNTIRSRQSWIALDVGAEAVRFANPLLPDTRSEIALPLIVGERVFGALDAQSVQPAAFDENYTVVLQGMADQIAIALNTAEGYQREQARAEQYNRLLQTAIELSEQTDRATLENRLVQSALSLLNADDAQLWIQAEDRLELKAVRTTRSANDPRLSIDQDLADQVFRTGLVLHFDTSPAQADYTSRIAQPPFRAALIVPVTWQGKIVGVFGITRSQPDQPFTPDDENSAQLLATQVAVVLANIALAERQQRTLDELNIVNRRLTGQAWAKQLQQLPGQAKYKQYTQSGIRAQLSTALPEVDLAMKTQQPVAWTQTDDQPVPTPYKATLATPITLRGEVLGALQVGEASQLRTWSDDDITFIQAVADQVAVALDNARLIEETERRAQREQLISEISRKMLAANDMRGIIQAAGDELGHALHVSRTEVKIGTEFGESATDTTVAKIR